jgi:hypothetical protein
MCPPIHIKKVQLPQEDDVKYLGLHLDRKLIWHTHIFAKRKQLGITLTKLYWLLRRKSKPSINNKFLIYKTIRKPICLPNTTPGYVFHFQYRNHRTIPIEGLAHDSGRTLLRVEYGSPKGSSDTNRKRRNLLLQLSIQCSPQRTPEWPNSEPNGATRQQAISKTFAKWSAYQISSLIVVFVILVFVV